MALSSFLEHPFWLSSQKGKALLGRCDGVHQYYGLCIGVPPKPHAVMEWLLEFVIDYCGCACCTSPGAGDLHFDVKEEKLAARVAATSPCVLALCSP